MFEYSEYREYNDYYIKLDYPLELKNISLVNNVYFVLRDIFLNSNNCDLSLEANNFNIKLTNGIYYEDRDNNFKYSDCFYNIIFIKRLYKWFNKISIHNLNFEQPYEYEDDDFVSNDYITFSNWIKNFNNLIFKLKIHLENLIKNEENQQNEKNQTNEDLYINEEKNSDLL